MLQLTTRTEPSATLRLPSPRQVFGAMVLAGLAAVVLARWLTDTGYVPVPQGLPDPGRLTSIGLPVVQGIRELAGIAVVGLLFLRCVGLPGRAAAAHLHLTAAAARWAWIWAGGTVVSIILTMSDMIGVPVNRLSSHLDLVAIVVGTQRVVALTATLWVALSLAMFGSRLLTMPACGIAMMLAAAALLPSSLAGHAGHHNFPLVAVIALSVHVLAASIWVGGLIALVVHLRAFPEALRRAVPRFSAVALVCILAVGASGVLESAIMLDDWAALWGTNRGHLMLAKGAALVGLAVVGYWHRRRTVAPAAAGRVGPLLGLAAGELVLMGATIGIAAVLATTA